MTWLIYTILSGFFIGFSFFFRKMAAKASGPLGGFIIEGIVYGVLMVIFFLFQQNKGAFFSNPWYASFSAIALFLGALFLYKALAIGELSLTNITYLAISLSVVLLISLFFLKESLSLKQILGIATGILAIFLLKS